MAKTECTFYHILNQTNDYMIRYYINSEQTVCSVDMVALGSDGEINTFDYKIHPWSNVNQKHILKARTKVQKAYEKWAKKGKPMPKKLDKIDNSVFENVESNFRDEKEEVHSFEHHRYGEAESAWGRHVAKRKTEKK